MAETLAKLVEHVQQELANMEAELKGTPWGTSAPIHRCERTRELPRPTALVVEALVSHFV